MRSLIEQKLAELEIALSLIPECDKVDYLKALQVAPDLIGVESDPVRFLRFANFNPMAAALGVIRYWKLRRETLGNTKAFLPLSLTGEGALDGEVIDFVRSGVSFAPVRTMQGDHWCFTILLDALSMMQIPALATCSTFFSCSWRMN